MHRRHKPLTRWRFGPSIGAVGTVVDGPSHDAAIFHKFKAWSLRNKGLPLRKSGESIHYVATAFNEYARWINVAFSAADVPIGVALAATTTSTVRSPLGRTVAIGAVAVWALGTATASATDLLGPANAYYWFSHWVSVSDLDAAAAQFAGGAVVIVAPSCPPEDPCVGRAAIRKRYLAWIAVRESARPLVDQRLDGTTMYSHDQRSYRASVLGDADWRDSRYAFRMREGRIESLTFGRRDGVIATALGR